MLVPYINSKESLVEYIRLKLTHPDLEINITEEQFLICIDEAVQLFCRKSYDGSQKKAYVLQLAAGQQEYLLPYQIMSVSGIQRRSTPDTFRFEDMVMLKFFNNVPMNTIAPSVSLIDVEIMRREIRDIEMMFSVKTSFEFNSTSKILYLQEKIHTNQEACLFCHEMINDANGYLYNNEWIKKYSVASARLQWGINLSKYNGSVLPNGLTLNAEIFLSQAEKEKTEALEELNSTYRKPLGIYIG